MAPRRAFGALLALLAVSLGAALRVEQTAFSGVWSVRAGDAPDDQALRSVVSSAAVGVWLQYAPSRDPATLATIRVRDGDSPYSLSWSAFTSSAPSELQIQAGVVVGGVEITVHKKQQLYQITAAGYGDVAVDHDVLAVDDAAAHVSATASGRGDVYLPPHVQLRVVALSLESRGYGSVRLVADDLTVGSLDVQTASGGAVKIRAARLQVEGAVSLHVLSQGGASLTATTLHAAQLNATTTSSGGAAVRVDDAWSSAVAQCEYQVSGDGNINAGAVPCADAIVTNDGRGDVTVRVSNSLAYTVSGYGNLYYVGARPHSITAHSSHQGSSLQAASWFENPSQQTSWADTYALPAHTPFAVSDEEREANAAAEVSAKAAAHGAADAAGKDAARAAAEAAAKDGAHTAGQANADKRKFPWPLLAMLAVLVLTVAAWNARQKRNAHGRADEKSRLLSEDAPVYI